ncbi:hypothetical protein N9C20_00025 [Luminiphilus sp.]|nr:hypothetical protein [Luminiphilus sp.]
MSANTHQQNPLHDLLTIKSASEQFPNIWPSEQSLRWAIHRHRDAMKRQGVLVQHGRRVFINARRAPDWVMGS